MDSIKISAFNDFIASAGESLDEQAKADFYNSTSGHKNEIDGYNCTKCNNRGYIAKIDSYGSMYLSHCECLKKHEVLAEAKRSGLGNLLKDYTFDKYIATQSWQESIKKLAMKFCKDEDAKWFFLGGQSGAGKTHLCSAICAHYLKSGTDVKYMIWASDAPKLKSLANDPQYQQEIKKFKDATVLYIDDFLKVRANERPTNADMRLAFEILNDRQRDDNKITIVSAEKSLDDMMGYDEATLGRLYQNTGDYKAFISPRAGRNYRLKTQEMKNIL